MSRSSLQQTTLLVILAIGMTADNALGQAPGPQANTDATAPGKSGPGMKGSDTRFLTLPVPRTLDLAHVEPEHYAVALGKDSQRIFEFLRDHVAYEAYEGCLRGPRGTLLAMAGNSVDRAALLASLLEKAGHKVRFARGVLTEADAKALVSSMWTSRPLAEPAQKDLDPAVKKMTEDFFAAVKRDFAMVRAQLQKMDKLPSPHAPLGIQALAKESQVHYWVQWLKDGTWMDLDPSFADAAPGQARAKAEQTMGTLPDALFHRVEVRLRLEERDIFVKGDTVGEAKSRVLFTWKGRAADLSGKPLAILHCPEKWTGPSADLKSALAQSFENTGKIKPIVIVGRTEWKAGGAFRQTTPSGKGIGGVGSLLQGEGIRSPVPVACAEFIDFDFVYPDGRTEKVTREIFDLVGPARRKARQAPTAQEIRDRQKATGQDLTSETLVAMFTTGRVDFVHRTGSVDKPKKEDIFLDDVLGGLALSMAVQSDSLLRSIGKIGRATLFYPDSPRVHILGFAVRSGKQQLTVDLRRDQGRAVNQGNAAEGARLANILFGITDGNLERLLLDHMVHGEKANKNWLPVFSTSSLMAKAHEQNIPCRLLTQIKPSWDPAVSQNAKARIEQELAQGYVVCVPERPVKFGDAGRLAWWRINPKTGETLAVTDDGLHGGTTEKGANEATVVVRTTAKGPTFVIALRVVQFGTAVFELLGRYDTYDDAVKAIGKMGAVFSQNPSWSDLIP